jgi:phosphohistidine phosphatase SixA
MREDRLPEQDDEYEPLTEEGKEKARGLAEQLQLKAEHGLPTIFLTSRFRHAYETACILWQELNPGDPAIRDSLPLSPLVALDTLTPYRDQRNKVSSDAYVGSVVRELSDISQFTKQVRADWKRRGELDRPDQEENILDLTTYKVIVIVSHYPRILQIALDLMGQDVTQFDNWRQLTGRKVPEYAEYIPLILKRGSSNVFARENFELS